MQDNIYDPFEQAAEEIELLQAIESRRDSYLDIPNMNFYAHYIYIDGDVEEQRRTRYGYWNLLADAGGFHDGLVLLITAFLSPF